MEPNSGKLLRLTPSRLTSDRESPSPPSSQALSKLPALPDEARKLRILDLDIENRPLSYWYDGNCTADITAIAWSWWDEERVSVEVQDETPSSSRVMLARFSNAYAKADIVTAHNVRDHDLKIIQGALAELQMPLLDAKLFSDTLRHLPRWKDLPKSQENLCEMLGIPAEKQHMSQAAWREANRLKPEGVKKTIERVVKDVVQHKLLRAKLIELGWLGPPRWWKP